MNTISATDTLIPMPRDGKNGEDAYTLDLDNEMASVPCNSAGTPLSAAPYAESHATVYKGAHPDSGWSFSKSDDGCTSTLTDDGHLSVTGLTSERATVTVTAIKGDVTRSAVMTVVKVRGGSNGSSPTIFSIETSTSAISRTKDGALNPATVEAYKQQTVGTATIRTPFKILKYLREGQDSTEQTLMGTGGTIKDISSDCTGIAITLYDTNGTTVLDKERIPIVSDGKDGESAVYYELISTNNDIHVSSDGTITPSSVTVKAYKITGATREAITPAGTNSEYAIVGVLTGVSRTQFTSGQVWNASNFVGHTPARFDLVLRSKLGSGNTYSDNDVLATLAVTVSKDGQDGGDGAFTSVVFKRATSKPTKPSGGTYSDAIPSGWTDAPATGSDPLWISRARFTVTMDGKSGSPTPEWSEPTPAADSTDIEFIWSRLEEPGSPTEGQHPYPESDSKWSKDPTDAIWMAMAFKSNGAWEGWKMARIKGESSLSLVVSPENITFKKGTAQYVKVRVNIYRGVTKVAYGGSTGQFECSTLSTSNGKVITDCLKWDFTVDSDGFFYMLIYDGSGIVNMDVPFTATYYGTGGNTAMPGVIHVTTVEDGEPGDPGEPAERYWLKPSVTQVVRSALGVCTPTSVSCRAYRQIGNGASEEWTDAEIKYAVTNRNVMASILRSYPAGTALSIGDTAVGVNFHLYKDDVQIDTVSVPVVDSGEPGERGKNGRLPIPYGEYDPDTTYTATDLVAPYVLQDGQYYVMNKSVSVKGVSPKSDYALNGSSATWLLMERFKAIYAELLMTRLGLIGKSVFYDEFMFSQYGRRNGSEVNYSGGYDIPIDAGGSFEPNFLVNFLTGALRCRKADITGTVNAESGQIGALKIQGNDLVGFIDGIEAVRLGVGSVTKVGNAFEMRMEKINATAGDRDGTVESQYNGYGCKVRRSGHRTDGRDGHASEDDTSMTCTVGFTLDKAATKMNFSRWDAGYDTRSGTFSGTATGTATLYKVSGTSRTQVAKWTLYERDTEYEHSNLSAGNYEVDISVWLTGSTGGLDWYGDILFYAEGLYATYSSMSGGKVEIAKDGLMCYQGSSKYLFYSQSEGLEVKFGDYGIKVGSGGLQKLVNGTWTNM